jgi:hypothetical protein
MIRTALALLAAVALCSCSKEQDRGGGAHGHVHGPHGGHLVELGTQHQAHLEVAHDAAAGTMRIWVLAGDAKTALAATRTPEVKLTTASGPKLLPTKAEDATNAAFAVTDDALKGGEPKGRITVEIDGKVYNPDLPDAH